MNIAPTFWLVHFFFRPSISAVILLLYFCNRFGISRWFLCIIKKTKNETKYPEIIYGAIGGIDPFIYTQIFIMKKIIGILIISFVTITSIRAQEPEVRKKQFNIEKSGLAIEGYDPVAYFTSNKAIEGKKEISTVYEGVTYRFATVQNRDAFKANPTKYEPQYGGWCAYAMGAKGEKVEVDPETFKIVNGKLYLFYNKYFNNTLKSWNKDETHLKANADQSWTKFIH